MFAFFFLMFLAQFIGNGDKMSEGDIVCYTYHLVDYQLGFISTVLPGQIFMFLFRKPNMMIFRIYSFTLLILAFLGVAYLLEKIYLSAPNRHKLAYSYVIGLFCISGGIFHIFYYKIGLLDVYWVCSFVIFFFLLQNKKTWFLIPFCFVFMVMVHFGAFLCYIPMMSIVLLYEAAVSREKSERKYLIIIFALSVVSAALVFGVLLYNGENNVSCTKEQLHALLQERGSDYFCYYDYFVFKEFKSDLLGVTLTEKDFVFIKSESFPVFIKTVLNRFIYQICYNYRLSVERIRNDNKCLMIDFSLILSLIPIVVFYHKCGKTLYRLSESNRLKKFSLFCGLAFVIFSFLGISIFTVDRVRYFHHTIICIFAFFLYLMFKEKKLFGEIIKSNIEKIETKGLLIFAVVTFLSRFDPYY